MRKKRKNPRKFFGQEDWMRRAVALAEKGRGGVSPNPMVGACVVKNGRLISEGYHRHYGGEHAEAGALNAAGRKAKGATLYVSLEPCSSWGKTPPCTGKIIASGIREVVIGSLDPNTQNHSKAAAALRKAGLKVVTDVLAPEVQTQNQWFFKFMKNRLPYVTLKMAQSLDGKIATHTGHARWISGPQARHFVHRLRAEQDAVLVGGKTLKKDDPLLSSREASSKFSSKPWRVALDTRLEVSPKARIFQGKQLTILAASEKRLSTLKNKKTFSATVLPVKEKQGRLDLHDLMRKLASLGVAKLLVEGGGELAWSLVEAGLVDKIFWIISPKFIGGREARTSLEGRGVALASQALPVKILRQTKLGEDILIEGELK